MSYTSSSLDLVFRDPADCMSTSDAADLSPSPGVACAHCKSANTVLDRTYNGGFINYCEPSDRGCCDAALVFECNDCGKLTALNISTDYCGWTGLSVGKIDSRDAARIAAQAKDRVRREAFEWAHRGGGSMSYTPHQDPVIDSQRRFESAIHLLMPVLTHGVIFNLVERLAVSRPDFCGCLDAIEKDTCRAPYERRLASMLSLYLKAAGAFSVGKACIGCHDYRCSTTVKKGGSKCTPQK